ncbi:unnamed protein product [Symbiodinium sp. CCMP2456]|nr:unnamed protein product [Symbiodinium sp. CCMP2456]
MATSEKGKGKGPPAPKASKGKGKESKAASGLGPPSKADAGMAWFHNAKMQHEDGHWEAEALMNGLGLNLAYPPSSPQSDTLIAESPFLATLMMLEIGRRHVQMFTEYAAKPKQVVDIKLGDGRSRADEVRVATVELTEEEKQERLAGLEEFAARCGLRADWEERAEQWLERHPRAADRSSMEEIASAELRLRFLAVADSSKRKTSRASSEERDKQERLKRETEAAMRAKEKAAAARQKERMDHFRSLDPANILSIAWPKAIGSHVIDGGSGGVMLVDLGASCVVLKPQGKAAALEMMAQHIADVLEVPIAHVRVVTRAQEEFREIQASLSRFINGDWKQAELLGVWDHADGVRDIGGNFFGVLEFAAGHVLMGHEGHDALQAPELKLMHQLGRLCAMDVLINNLDRIPLPVWQNEGNLGNVIVARDTVVGIDQQVNLVMPGIGLDNYLGKVATLVAACSPEGDPSLITAKLCKALEENCAAVISNNAAADFVHGLRHGLEDIAHHWRGGSLKKGLEKGQEACLKTFIIDTPAMDHTIGTQPQLSTLDAACEFVCAVAEKISSDMPA